MAKQDYYKLLDVPRNASRGRHQEGLSAPRHEVSPGSQSRRSGGRTQVQGGQGGLRGAHRRAKARGYDQFGHAGLEGGRGGGFSAGEAFGDIFGEMFGDIFSGGQRSRSQVFRGADLRYELELDLEQAVFGTETEIQIPSLAECKTCKGTGAAKGSTPKTCDTCHGQGQVRVQQSIFTIQQPCPRCKGRGKIISNPCDTCYGQGRVRQEKTLAGLRAGRRRHRRSNPPERRGRGRAATAVRPAICTSRSACASTRSSSAKAAISPARCRSASPRRRSAGSVEVPTLDGEVVIKIPAETQSGRVFRVREKGVRAGARRRRRRPVLPGGGRNPGESERRAEGSAARNSRPRCSRAATSRANSRSSRA